MMLEDPCSQKMVDDYRKIVDQTKNFFNFDELGLKQKCDNFFAEYGDSFRCYIFSKKQEENIYNRKYITSDELKELCNHG